MTYYKIKLIAHIQIVWFIHTYFVCKYIYGPISWELNQWLILRLTTLTLDVYPNIPLCITWMYTKNQQLFLSKYSIMHYVNVHQESAIICIQIFNYALCECTPRISNYFYPNISLCITWMYTKNQQLFLSKYSIMHYVNVHQESAIFFFGDRVGKLKNDQNPDSLMRKSLFFKLNYT